MRPFHTTSVLGGGALLWIGLTAGCSQPDSGSADAGAPFGDTGGLIAVNPTTGGSGGTSSSGTSSGGGSSTGGTTTSGEIGFDTSGGSTTSGSGGSSAGTTSSGATGGTTGGNSGGTSGGGGSSSGGTGGDCSNGVPCSGALPYCDQNRSPPTCVAGPGDTLGETCTTDADCNFGVSGSEVVCNQLWTCASGCSSDGDCPAATPYCDTNSLSPACVAGPSDTLGETCSQDSDCNFGLMNSQVVCGPDGCATGCHYDSDCAPTECCNLSADPGTCSSC